jgi:NADPH:quinone reductase-like Zn-dependent oxidoreductase
LEEYRVKAIVSTGYGRPDEVLKVREVAMPVIADDEVLVRVRAASIHIGDAHGIRGVPKVMRPLFKRMWSKSGVPGSDLAGTIEAVGASVSRWKPGDEVFGWCKGAFAEYAGVAADALAAKPESLSFDEAAAVGVSAFTALQALRDHGKVQSGHKVLITGASGGVGSFAVQVAKHAGAQVTGVCSTRNVDMVKALGADSVIDYSKQDWAQLPERYDVILDNVGRHGLAQMRACLTPTGVLLANGAPVSGWVGGLGHFAKAMTQAIFIRGQARPFVSMPNNEDLETLRGLVESGVIRPVVGATFNLDEGPDAVASVADGGAPGKTGIVM